ncbi:MAG: TIGR04282 family arsenosugar biosynthesis glycosyltransferase [bacterium]
MKYPASGKVKTRLGAEIGDAGAAKVYQLFIELTLNTVQKAGCHRAYVAYEPEERYEDFRKLVGPGFELFPQQGGDLGERMWNAIAHVSRMGSPKIIVYGSDSPTLPAQFIEEAIDGLETCDLVLGPANDGGYYLVGVKKAVKEIFEGIPWSSSSVLQSTLERARDASLSVHLLPEWYDVDQLDALKQAARDDATGLLRNFLEENNLS